MCCERQCLGREKVAICMHQSCYAFNCYVFPSRPVPKDFIYATEYGLLPFMQDPRREHHLQLSLAQQFSHASIWPRGLPFELWIMISGSLVRECAIVSTQVAILEHQPTPPTGTSIDLGKPVYASYVLMEGRYYVHDLHNEDPRPGSNGITAAIKTHMLFPGRCKTAQPNVDILMALDHIGIRRVLFIPQGNTGRDTWYSRQRPVPGLWWKHIPARMLGPLDKQSTLTIRNDVCVFCAQRGRWWKPFSTRPEFSSLITGSQAALHLPASSGHGYHSESHQMGVAATVPSQSDQHLDDASRL